MTKDTLFLKILVSKNWVLQETWSNQNKFWNNDKAGYNPYQFVYCRQETFKMGVHATKSRLPINSRYKFSFFPRYFYIKKWQLSIFFLFKGERHAWMTSIKIITKFREVFSRFEKNKNVINISSVKNWFKFLWALF